MDESNRSQEITVPNIHVPENEKVLAYLKEMHPFHEIIVPFSPEKVSKDVTPSDFIGRFFLMSSLPGNSKYVVYGCEALVHPDTGIIFGFITGTSVIYRMPDTLLRDVAKSNIRNFRAVNEIGIDGMENLESNWIISPSVTEQLVRKCFDYYSQVSPEEEVVHLNFEMDLTTPRTREFEKNDRLIRVLPFAVIVGACVLVVLLGYAASYLIKLL